MDKKNQSFKFKYSVIVWVLLAVVIALSLAGFVWNVIALIYNANVLDKVKTATNVIMIIITLALNVFVISLIFNSKYTITKDYLVQSFGLIKAKIPLKQIVEITHFKKSNKLVIYFSDEKYTVAVISPESYNNFVMCLREFAPEIIYDVQIDGEDTPE